jgi:hypothetical protein
MSNQLNRSWEFVFVPSFRLILIDIILRILIFILAMNLGKEYDYLYIIVSLHIISTIIIFSVAIRSRKSIEAFLQMRLISESANIEGNKIGFREIIIKTRLWKWRFKENFKQLAIGLTIPIIMAFSVWITFPSDISVEKKVIAILSLFLTHTFFLFVMRNNIISKNIISIKENGEKLTPERRYEIVKFINKKSISNVMRFLSETNDVIILELQTKIKIFRERLENISFEAIFLGALTFATFAQFINDEQLQKIMNGNTFKTELTKSIEIVFFNQNDQNESKVNSLKNKSLSKETKFLKKRESDSNHITFLVVCGSLLSSVFYIVLLLKRFAILKTIELAQLKIEKANSWNIREENQLNNLDKNSNFALKYTDQIQIELSHANEICSEINSNLNILTIMRFFGLVCFFIVLLVSAKLVNETLYVLVLFITFYGIVVTILLNTSLMTFKKWLPVKLLIAINSLKSFKHKISDKEMKT